VRNIKIPLSFILEIDDVGWDDGRDLRLSGKASRSGLPRNHALEDYEFIEKLANATGKTVSVALVMGDFDKDNYLRGKVGFTHDPYGWDRASSINLENTEKYVQTLERANIEYLLHGVLHGRYDEEGRLINEREFLLIKKKGDSYEAYLPSVEEFNYRLDVFYKLYEAIGMKKNIKAFVMPCGIDNASYETVKTMARELYKRGIRYWPDSFNFPEFTPPLMVVEGVALFRWGRNAVNMPWNAYDIDPDTLAPFFVEGSPKNSCLHGSHWTNFLRFNPKKNIENLPLWVNFYKTQGEVYGSMLGKDLAEAVNQLFYYTFSKMSENGDTLTFDLSEVEKNKLDCHKNEFFISFLHGTEPKSCVGGEISLYEKHKDFDIYKIIHSDDILKILI
jgi:hypothetical protein